jgi:hypothetical protein
VPVCDKNAGAIAGNTAKFTPKVSADKKAEWDRQCARWLVKRSRPLSLCENDTEFREWISTITGGRYTPPVTSTVLHQLCHLSAESTVCLRQSIAYLQKDGVEVCIAGDIWGENGISLLAIMGYWIDTDFVYQEKLLVCEPFSDVAHTGDEIERTTKEKLAKLGIGSYDPENGVDTVMTCVYGSTSDEGSNMKKAWNGLEGGPCVNHQGNNCLATAMEEEDLAHVIKKVKGICAHFHRSTKGLKHFQKLQKGCELPELAPPAGAKTRWCGVVPMLIWVANNRPALKRYDRSQPTGCAALDDGTVYKDYLMCDDEHEVVRQLVRQIFCDIYNIMQIFMQISEACQVL